ncbi:hypothetical protein RA280_40215 [Cupriavidus sp. CV2]|uniref:hypothetical protein n=1 Tax=Cupriavidus ulmosensis TaxID=3065913 RepID=UPI00296AF01F|nr:hypothetical protein [Cupriavidus sp. CV2]MDW3687849.1 hypothetical protein [Cupriavidus sp. CV2]
MTWVKDINSFHNFIGYVVIRAPDRFPIEDYLPLDQQMNLGRAFAELRHGLEFVDPTVAGEEKKQKLSALLDASFAAYSSGDDVKGAHLLQDFEGLIFKNTST